MKAIKVILFFIVVILASCENQMENGLVEFSGNEEVDGCGWVIEINKALYAPINLDVKFQKDSLRVLVDYQVLKSTRDCGDVDSGKGIKEIRILNIR